MRARTAGRLARWAGSARSAGPTRWRARWAARRLARAGDRGDQHPVDAVWAAWLAVPAAPLWTLLDRWRRPAGAADRGASLVALGAGRAEDPVVRAALVEAAGRADHPVGVTARRRIVAAADPALVEAVCAAAAAPLGSALVPFCAEHGLVPADPVRRAVFFLLTARPGRYRAADPDGSLLATGYAAADAVERMRLRVAMVDAGELDLVRIVAGAGRERVTAIDRMETDYLAARLVDRADWAGLWRLLRDVPLGAALDLAGRIPVAGRPTDPAGRSLLAALAGAAAEVAAAAAAPYRHRGTLPGLPGDVSFAPDGSQVAVLNWASHAAGSAPPVLAMYELPGGEPAWAYRFTGPAAHNQVLRVAHAGAGTAVVGRPLAAVAAGRLVRTTATIQPWIDGPAQLPGGVAGLDGLHRLLRFGAPAGEPGQPTDRLELTDGPAPQGYEFLRSEPVSGQLLFYTSAYRNRKTLAEIGGPDRLLLRDAAGAPARADYPGEIRRVEFAGPDRLVVVGRGLPGTGSAGPVQLPPGLSVSRWTRHGDRLVLAAATGVADDRGFGLLLAANAVHVDGRWFDVDDLAPVRPARVSWPAPVWWSADGTWLATRGDPAADAPPGLDLYQLRVPAPVVRLLDRPMAALRPADLDTVEAAAAAAGAAPDPAAGAAAAGAAAAGGAAAGGAAAGGAVAGGAVAGGAADPAGAAVVALLRACLAYRFGADIEVAAGGPATRADDIALADGPGC